MTQGVDWAMSWSAPSGDIEKMSNVIRRSQAMMTATTMTITSRTAVIARTSRMSPWVRSRSKDPGLSTRVSSETATEPPLHLAC